MSLPRALRESRVLGFLLVVVIVIPVVSCQGPAEPSTGWGYQALPETPPTQEMLLGAAKAAIAERYPMYAVSERSGFVYALSPVTLEGASKARRQISVVLLRNFTGAYEPVVRVRQYVEVGSPAGKADPGSGNTGLAKPLAADEWLPLDYLPYEEQQIYEAIFKKLAQQGGAAKDAAGQPPGQS